MTESSAPSNRLTVEGVSKSYPTSVGELTVLRDANLALAGGEAIAIMGPSGSGKSTLLHILGGLERPTAGRVVLNDLDPNTLGNHELARFRNRSIGFVFQDHHLLPQCSVLENVLIPTLAADGADEVAIRRAQSLIERVGLTDRATHRPAELSGGERQRVAIARALINRPALLLCDEPTGNLDKRNAASVADLLVGLHQTDGVILVVVTHSESLAARLPKRMTLNDGRLEPG